MQDVVSIPILLAWGKKRGKGSTRGWNHCTGNRGWGSSGEALTRRRLLSSLLQSGAPPSPLECVAGLHPDDGQLNDCGWARHCRSRRTCSFFHPSSPFSAIKNRTPDLGEARFPIFRVNGTSERRRLTWMVAATISQVQNLRASFTVLFASAFSLLCRERIVIAVTIGLVRDHRADLLSLVILLARYCRHES